MLGRYPRAYLNGTTSKGEPHSTQSHEIVRLPSSEEEKPVLLPPHQIVIGFDVASKHSKSFQGQASESPRSVLEPYHLCFRVHHQQSQSPRSPLGSLLSGQLLKGPCIEGAALCLKVGVDTQEVANGVNEYRAFSRRGHVAGNVDGAGDYHTSSKTEHIACDVGCNIASMKSKPFAFPRVDHVGVGQVQPWKHDCRERVFSGSGNCPQVKTFPGDCEDDDSEDGDDDEDSNIHVSLFSTASPVSDYSRHNPPSADFLSKCFRCRRHLLQGKDIFMYRGDRAFCSQECRHQQIVVDDRKEKCSSSAACVSRASTHHRTAQRATQAAVAT